MATYSELRQDILITLDQDPNAPGDIYDLVNIKMKSVLYEIISRVWPQELLTLSSNVTVTSADTELSIASDFLITDMLKPFALVVNDDPTNTDSSALTWKYINPELWVRAFNRLVGNVHNQKSYTILGDKVVLNPWPQDTATYEAGLWYYKDIAAITDNGIPEFPKQHHSVLINGVCKQFPQLFSGDRLGLFATLMQQYDDGIKALANDMDASSTDYAITLSPTMRVGANTIRSFNWGGRQ